MTTLATIQLGDCRDIIATLPDCSVDSIVTDPPYELGFMGKAWDGSGIAYDPTLWAQCLRVLKPGGHLLAFGGTRTYHRMAAAIEDAGFEIRDSIHWLYGSGFPKSLDVSKAIDKQRHDRPEVLAVTNWVRAMRDVAGITNSDIDDAFGFAGMAGHWTSRSSQPSVPTLEQVPTLLNVLGVTLDDVPEEIRRLLWNLNGRKGQPGENWARREVVGRQVGVRAPGFASDTYRTGGGDAREFDITAPATDAARQWEGWGTALKPAHEPIVVARKPLSGTVAATVLQHGTGALNVNGCRIESASGDEPLKWETPRGGIWRTDATATATATAAGRWPANLVITHAAECADDCATGCPVAELDRQSGVSNSSGAGTKCSNRDEQGKCLGHRNAGRSTSGETFHGPEGNGTPDTGGASRFFTITEWDPIADAVPFRYEAKPSRSERDAGLAALEPKVGAGKGNGLGRTCATCGSPVISGCQCLDRTFINPAAKNHHPTVKPLALMRWLVRLVTPPGGTVLEPFAGSGTTMAAAILEDRHVIGCELTADYLPIIEGRIAWARTTRDAIPPTLFDEVQP